MTSTLFRGTGTAESKVLDRVKITTEMVKERHPVVRGLKGQGREIEGGVSCTSFERLFK